MVTFQVGLKHFKQITSEDFFIGVSYEDVVNARDNKIHLSLRRVPEFASHVRIVPEEVDYLIEQQQTGD